MNGQPASIRFNVSHSRRHGLIALAGSGRLGVDVEPLSARRNLDALMEEALTPAEQARLACAGEQRRRQLFFRLWTMKEALIKALGTGFSVHVSEFEIPAPMCNGQRLCEFRFPHLPDVRWRLENIAAPEGVAAIPEQPPKGLNIRRARKPAGHAHHGHRFARLLQSAPATHQALSQKVLCEITSQNRPEALRPCSYRRRRPIEMD